jgi:single-stranded-DNA-specific exonuclease
MRRERNYQTEKKWLLPRDCDKAKQSLDRILERRGITGAQKESFLHPDYEKLTDPFQIPDMKVAVGIIQSAVKNHKKIAVYGDYDVDGVTATALLVTVLNKLGADTVSYIPSRQDEGYGLNREAIDTLKDQGVELIITVDCGSTSFDEAKYAKRQNIELIITDHHTLKLEGGKNTVPEAPAIVNPKRLTPESPLYELAGAGVAFYLIRALYTIYSEKLTTGQEKWLLDLVALGTICDIVPLTGENRILAYYGLKVLSKSRRIGIQALAAASEVTLDHIDSYKVGFLLGPRLNAAGRLEHAKAALDLLLTEDEEEAAKLAHKLNQQNLERQELTEQIVNEARELIEADGNKKSIYLLAKPNWPAGVVGIVASRLVEEYGKPMLVMEDLGEELKGSARSVTDLNIIEALSDSGELLTHFGGHAFAAGFRFPKDKFLLLEERLIKFTDQKISVTELTPTVQIDDVIAPLEADLDLANGLLTLQPFGRDNAKPIFASMKLSIQDMRLVGNPALHLKLTLSDGENSLTGIAFGWGETVDLDLDKKYDIAFTLEINEWQDRKNVEFRLIDIRKHK